MTGRYDDVRIAPDEVRAEELRRRLHTRMADPAGSRAAEVDEEVVVSQNPLPPRSRTRVYLAAAAAVVIVGGVVGIALATADSDNDNAPILSAPPVTTPDTTSP